MTSRARRSRRAAGALTLLGSRRLVIARFGTTYDLMMAMIDISRLTADTIAAL